MDGDAEAGVAKWLTYWLVWLLFSMSEQACWAQLGWWLGLQQWCLQWYLTRGFKLPLSLSWCFSNDFGSHSIWVSLCFLPGSSPHCREPAIGLCTLAGWVLTRELKNGGQWKYVSSHPEKVQKTVVSAKQRERLMWDANSHDPLWPLLQRELCTQPLNTDKMAPWSEQDTESLSKKGC